MKPRTAEVSKAEQGQRKQHYTPAELDAFALDDLARDMEHALNQAAKGPFFPDKGVTAESLRAYAEEFTKALEEHGEEL